MIAAQNRRNQLKLDGNIERIDRPRGSLVATGMSVSRMLARSGRALVLGVCVAAVAQTGCGGKDKKDKTTPATAGGNGSANGDPTVPGDVETGTFGGGDGNGGNGGAGAGGGVANNGGGGPDGAGGGDAEPEIKPPGLDLSDSEKASRVRGSLANARAALSKTPPDAETGVAEAKAALAVDESNLEAMLYLAHANYVKGYYDKAEYVLGRAIKTREGQQTPKLQFLYGLVYEATDRDELAFKSYERAVNLDPNYRSALLNVGVHYLKNKRYNDATIVYQKLTGPLGSKDPAAWANLGSAYRGSTAVAGISDPDRRSLLLKAQTAYNQAIKLDKNYANTYYNLGVLYLDADPFPSGGGELDTLKRLELAKKHFADYAKLPGANKKRADEQAAVAQKLYDREVRIRDKQRKREEARKKKAGQG